jgi:hypothetical protein
MGIQIKRPSNRNNGNGENIMSKGLVKVNKAKCLSCGDILISKESNVLVTCSCGSLQIAGGIHFLERRGTENYKELSQMADVSDMNPNENIGRSPPKM